MSARKRTCSSETPSGTTCTDVSAKGTRAYSACTPSIRCPKIHPIPPTASQCAAIPALHGPQRPQEVIAGTSTRSPFFKDDTAAPVSTTVPTASCPRMRPSVTAGTSPLRMCRSVPQIVVVSTLTITSVGSWMPGSSTVSQDRCPGRRTRVPSCPPRRRRHHLRVTAPLHARDGRASAGSRGRRLPQARGSSGPGARRSIATMQPPRAARPGAPAPSGRRATSRSVVLRGDLRRHRDHAEQPREAERALPHLRRAEPPRPADVRRPLDQASGRASSAQTAPGDALESAVKVRMSWVRCRPWSRTRAASGSRRCC